MIVSEAQQLDQSGILSYLISDFCLFDWIFDIKIFSLDGVGWQLGAENVFTWNPNLKKWQLMELDSSALMSTLSLTSSLIMQELL